MLLVGQLKAFKNELIILNSKSRIHFLYLSSKKYFSSMHNLFTFQVVPMVDRTYSMTRIKLIPYHAL